MSQIIPPEALAFLAKCEQEHKEGTKHCLLVLRNDALLEVIVQHVTCSCGPDLVVEEPEPTEINWLNRHRRETTLTSNQPSLHFHCILSEELDTWKSNNPEIKIAREFVVE